MRQSIRENSTELRELEKKLNYAYMNKERALQREQKKLSLREEKVSGGAVWWCGWMAFCGMEGLCGV